MYHHIDIQGERIALPAGKVVCVGRNYAEHARELNNPVSSSPLLFMKPSTALVGLEAPLALPRGRGEVHHEVELALLVGAPLREASEEAVDGAIWGFGLALDLTLREVQARLKAQGHPWEIAKAFDGSCPVGPFVRGVPSSWAEVRFGLDVGGEARQRGCSADMLFPVRGLVAEMSRHFTLLPGDVILTGTPSGVGPLAAGDALRLTLEGVGSWSAEVAR